MRAEMLEAVSRTLPLVDCSLAVPGHFTNLRELAQYLRRQEGVLTLVGERLGHHQRIPRALARSATALDHATALERFRRVEVVAARRRDVVGVRAARLRFLDAV